ncbi:uncharacterized protein LOC108906935 [Anoplophora glabripennis]|uniref:uncharacterized protein LOC108906935 n=1 Tax=Anoplophora glabripennis TaxID=217634 RepID=UPI0008746BB6|nr:uncharacterized protein LOC108906935 [Anoplophora glabripennis]
MCTSLSKENYLSPIENAEFSELKVPLMGEKYEQEVKSIKSEYPGIFDVDMTELEIELLEDEIELALEENKHLDELAKINEALQIELVKDIATETSEEIKTALKLKSTQEMCNSLGEKLDEVNGKLHAQLVKYGSNLYNFEFGSVPNFINNIDMKKCKENFDNITSFLTPLLEVEFYPSSLSMADAENQTFSDTISTNDPISNTLNIMKNRILHSHQNYVIMKIEVEKAREMLHYLNKTDIDSILHLEENAYTQMSREGKEETKRRMCGMLDNISEKLAEHHIAQTKYKYAQQEQKIYQAKLESLKEIEDMVIKFLSQYILLKILYIQEKKDIDNSDQFFRKILQYINKDLQSCTLRTEKMNKIICKYGDYNLKSIGERFNMIKSIVRILTNEPDFDLQKSLEVVCEFKSELGGLENKLFCSDFYSHKEMVKELRNNVNILQSFLICGPTHRIVVMPPELQKILGEVEEHLKQQITSIKSAVQINSSMNKIPDKWQNYRRQLWMYFYTDPKKMFLILQEIEEEFKSKSSV